MANFFDNFNDEDEEVLQAHIDVKRVQATSTGDTSNRYSPRGTSDGISPEAYLNDYRNRMPFHYIEQGTDGYYFWQYGATMEIEFEISDEVAVTDPKPSLYPVEGAVAGEVNVVDKETHVIHLGTMSLQDNTNYYTKEEVDTQTAVAAQALFIERSLRNTKDKELQTQIDSLQVEAAEIPPLKFRTDNLEDYTKFLQNEIDNFNARIGLIESVQEFTQEEWKPNKREEEEAAFAIEFEAPLPRKATVSVFKSNGIQAFLPLMVDRLGRIVLWSNRKFSGYILAIQNNAPIEGVAIFSDTDGEWVAEIDGYVAMWE